MAEVVLEMRGIGKDFPGVRALDGVDFQARAGEVLALVGENGAGKSTLMKILSGVWPHPSYQGDIYLRGERVRFATTRAAERAGIAIIHQELNLIPELTVAENIFLDRQPTRWGRIDWNRLYGEAQRLFARLRITDIRPVDKVAELTVGKQQIVEIAKALSLDARVLIFDEPTSALTDVEVAELFRIIGDLRQGGVCMVYISHKMDEIAAICDRVAVLRDGKTIGATAPLRPELVAADDGDGGSGDSDGGSDGVGGGGVSGGVITMDQIIHRMVGRDIHDMYPKQVFEPGDVTLEVADLTVAHPFVAGAVVVDRVSLAARKGEILGISGLMGSGRSELVLGIFGAHPRGDCTGAVRLHGRALRIRSPRDAIRAGIGLVTEDRKLLGLVLGHSVRENLSLSALGAIANRWGVIDPHAEMAQARRNVRELRIKTPGVDVAVDTLSGGNQQKVVIAKWLNTEPDVLIVDEPTRGVDVGAKVEIYRLLNRLVERGVTVIMISSDLPEVMGMSDRILVMCEGRKAGEFARGEATVEQIMQHATGHADKEALDGQVPAR